MSSMNRDTSAFERNHRQLKDTVRQLCRRLGVSPDTVRHYREQGLLHPSRLDNGYSLYDLDDMLRMLLLREMRSMDVSLADARDFFEHRSIGDYNDWIARHRQAVEGRIRLLQLEQQRLRETEVYASCGIRILGKVEEFDGPGTWAVGAIGVDDPYTRGDMLARWIDHLPFTYVSATISLEDLTATPPDQPYPMIIGAGALEKYIGLFDLPLPSDARYQPDGHFIRTCIRVRNIPALTPGDLAHLYRYAEEHGYTFASCTGGRVLFMEERPDGPEYYLLVWVRVETALAADR